MNPDLYIQAWRNLDVNNDGKVNLEDLRRMLMERGIRDHELSKKLLDARKLSGNSSNITMYAFCQVLGINMGRLVAGRFTRQQIDEYISIWCQVDTNWNEIVEYEELIGWINRKGLNEGKMSDHWQGLFDPTNSGRVTLDYFCQVLNISPSEVQAYYRSLQSPQIARNSSRAYTAVGLPSGCEYISGDMSTDWQVKVCNLVIEGIRVQSQMKDAPTYIKKQADAQFGQLWHTVIVNGQFWCFYGHEPGYSFVFRYNKYIIIIWKTPSM